MNSDQGLFNDQIHVSTRVNDFHFRRELIDQRIENMRKEDPSLRKMSYDCIAEKLIGLSRTSFFRIRTGALPDPKASSVWLISSALDISVCELMGLPAQESAHTSASIHSRLEEQDKEIIRLRAELENAREKCTYFEQMYNERSALITRLLNDLSLQRKVMTGMLIALIALVPILVIFI